MDVNWKKGPLAWMTGHSVAANLIMVACLVGGFMYAKQIKQEVFPSFDIEMVIVSVQYPGASPEEIEKGILLSIEDAVSGLDGVDEVKSSALEGSGRVTIEAIIGADMQQLVQDVQKEVDGITTFPTDIEEPRVSFFSGGKRVISMVIYGDAREAALREIAEEVRDDLLQDKGITQVKLGAIRPFEISIEISQENLRRYNLTLEQVAARLRSESVDLPAGGIKTDAGEILLRVSEQRDYGYEFGRIPIISTPDGSQVLLEDIARVSDGFQDLDKYALYDGKPAVMLKVYRVGDQTPIEVSDTVHQYVEQLRKNLPKGLDASILSDRSEMYRQRVDLLLRNGLIGLVLVLVVLALFLEVRLAFWVMMGIPISFLGSFLFLPMFDISINLISLFAYIIALGIVVDDAIVIGENVYHYRQDGMPPIEAAVKGVREMLVPVTFSVLTNVVTFIPLAFVPGFIGKIFKLIPFVVISVFMISLLECLFILPAHLGHLKNKKRGRMMTWLHSLQQNFSHAFKRWVRKYYGPFLDFTLRNRYLTIVVAISILMLAVSYAKSGRMGLEVFPKVESDFSLVTLTLPYGSPVEKTEKLIKYLTASAQKVADESGHGDELVDGIFAEIGSSGSHTGNVTVYLAAPEIRSKIMSTDEFTERWRKAAGEIAGIESIFYQSDAGGPGAGQGLTVELNHRNIDVLSKASAELAEVLSGYPRVSDVDDGFQPGKEQLDFTVTQEGKSLGITASDVARKIRNSLYGREVLRQQRGRNSIKIMVRLPESERVSLHTIDELMIRASSGAEVPLREVTKIKYGRSYTAINRRSGRRVVLVSANVSPRSKTGEVLNDMLQTALPALMQKYPGLRYSFEGGNASTRESLGSLKTTYPLALLIIYAMLAIPFRSYTQPLIVMVSIPFGVIGAVLGHLIMGYSLSILSMFGIVALSGVVVNDSLIMVDAANRLKREGGGSSHSVIHAAGIQRFRPILLTTLTTCGGLAPMIMETSRQAKFLIPMAISLGFGILFATFITLILVPSLYMVVEDSNDAVKKIPYIVRKIIEWR